jgi:hypothetical protein
MNATPGTLPKIRLFGKVDLRFIHPVIRRGLCLAVLQLRRRGRWRSQTQGTCAGSHLALFRRFTSVPNDIFAMLRKALHSGILGLEGEWGA